MLSRQCEPERLRPRTDYFPKQQLSDGAAGAAIAVHVLSLLSPHSCGGLLANRRVLLGGRAGTAARGIMTKRISANRRNAKKSTGPNNTTSTRFNATKHGLLAAGITELDDAEEYLNILRCLDQAYLANLETFLLERIALTMIRLRRSARLEAEYITHLLNPPIYGEAQEPLRMPLFERPLIDPGLPAPVDSWKFDPVVKTFQRYDTALENKLFRAT